MDVSPRERKELQALGALEYDFIDPTDLLDIGIPLAPDSSVLLVNSQTSLARFFLTSRPIVNDGPRDLRCLSS
ncbi:hypothetical protein CEP54_009362 [Fusarium duplospermum]|uniref:Uncharacterized protein n=1 Tax=Fusarium duplospermum TaxID=1325734 RepID=A0A428PR29_9HYPO|nr:hypothetical protein CEP54_009362 [Fusarium duplospermum]